MEFVVISLLNGVSYGLLLFMLSAGLTLILSMLGVLNFAHASFYMLGAYLGYTLTAVVGFAPAFFLAPLAVAALGAVFQQRCLRRAHAHGHVPELLITFGLSFVVLELVQLLWGTGPVDYRIPAALEGSLFTLYGTQFPIYRAFLMGVALAMLVAMWLLLTGTRIGLIVRAALTHPAAAEALGHNVPRVFTGIFAVGAGLAGLAGVIGGNAFVTEPGMAAAVGSVVFVIVVVGGMGSLLGAFTASLLVGMLQTFAVGVNFKLVGQLSVSQIAPVLPFVLLVFILIFRPKGLMGQREG